MHHLSPLQDILLQSLLGSLVGVAWAWRDRLMAWQNERRARAVEREQPVKRLETRRVMRLTPRRVNGLPTIIVAVLVSELVMGHRVLRALAGRANLRFASTWAELQQIVARVSPCAIIADPAADEGGDPAGHLARFSHDWGIPVVLYTQLTPRSAGVLLQLGRAGIRHIVFYRYDDAPHRFVDAIDWDRSGPPLRAA